MNISSTKTYIEFNGKLYYFETYSGIEFLAFND